MSQLKVNTIRHTGASSDAVTLASDGSCTANLTNPKSNRNLIINGAMNVAQRGISSTGVGYQTVDRFQYDYGGENEAVTQAQHALSSSDTGPWGEGFRYSHHATNGNQTGGAGTGDHTYFSYRIEAQDIAQSGWDYTSTSSYLTLSYWVKSSVAGTYYGYIYSYDGTPQTFSISTGELSANTWKKVTVKIPGYANLQFDNNEESGLALYFLWPYCGTDRTSSSNTLNAWQAYSSGNRMPDFPASTWWTTNDATMEVTGVQLEVGDVATDFEHRSYGDDLLRCMRYCQRYDTGGDTWVYFAQGNVDNDNETFPLLKEFMIPMRVKPSSMTTTGTASDYYVRRDSSKECSAVPTFNAPGPYSVQVLYKSASHGWETGHNVKGYLKDSGAYLLFSAEL